MAKRRMLLDNSLTFGGFRYNDRGRFMWSFVGGFTTEELRTVTVIGGAWDRGGQT